MVILSTSISASTSFIKQILINRSATVVLVTTLSKRISKTLDAVSLLLRTLSAIPGYVGSITANHVIIEFDASGCRVIEVDVEGCRVIEFNASLTAVE
jgi:hypothetical protein